MQPPVSYRHIEDDQIRHLMVAEEIPTTIRCQNEKAVVVEFAADFVVIYVVVMTPWCGCRGYVVVKRIERFPGHKRAASPRACVMAIPAVHTSQFPSHHQCVLSVRTVANILVWIARWRRPFPWLKV